MNQDSLSIMFMTYRPTGIDTLLTLKFKKVRQTPPWWIPPQFQKTHPNELQKSVFFA